MLFQTVNRTKSYLTTQVVHVMVQHHCFVFVTQSYSPTRQTALKQLKMYTSKYPSSKMG